MSVPDRTPASEAVGPGSIPGRAIVPCECDGLARQTSNLQDGVRLLGGVLKQIIVLGVCRIRTRPREGRRPGSIPGEDTYLTLEPDGQATGCNPVEAGSTPASVFDQPTAGSDYIFLLRSARSEPNPRWLVY